MEILKQNQWWKNKTQQAMGELIPAFDERIKPHPLKAQVNLVRNGKIQPNQHETIKPTHLRKN